MMPAKDNRRLHCGFVPYAGVFEEFYPHHRIGRDYYLDEYQNEWTFQVVRLLLQQEFDVTLFHFSMEAREVEVRRHQPTGARVVFLPAAALYRALWWLRYHTRLGWNHAWRVRSRDSIMGYAARLTPRVFTRVLGRDIDVVFQQDYEGPSYDAMAVAARLARKPLVTFFSGGYPNDDPIERRVRPRTMPLAVRHVCMTMAECERLRATYRLRPEQVVHWINGVDETAFRPASQAEARAAFGVPPPARVALFMGRLDERTKHVETLLRAFATIAPSLPDALLVIAGTGPDEEKLKSLAAELRLSERVRFTGFVSGRETLAQWYVAADVLCLTSVSEGLPNVVLEAMACARPVVAMRVGGLPDLVRDDETGFLVDVDDVPTLAERLRRLLSDAAMRERFGDAARRRVEQEFAQSKCAAALAVIIREAAGGNKSRRSRAED